MTFANPFVLWFLGAALVIVFTIWFSRGRPVTLPLDGSQAPQSHLLGFLVNVVSCLPAFLFAVAVLILAKPQITGIPENEREMNNILFCLDASGSMNAPAAGGGRRFDQALEAIHKFTTYREGDSFGLTVFGNEVWHWVPITRDTSAIAHSAPFLDPRKLPVWFGGTQIAKALLACKDVLVREKTGDRMIILLSDGGSSDIMGAGGARCAMALKESQIVVYAIHIGTQVPQGLYTIAGITGGQVFSVVDKVTLDAVFRYIDQMQKAKFRTKAPEPMDFYRPFCLAGLALLAAYVLSLFGLRYTPW
ncbi:MAG: VWA domain-containing protein [Lentisphaeria bacterium]|nr:VWA domain-containing protein [Lentisphaeria bacterium]